MQNQSLSQTPRFQEFHIEGIHHISPVDTLEVIKRGEAIMLDVREPEETALERVELPDVLYHPLSVILDRLKHLPTDKLIVAACPGGVRSAKVINLLLKQGFKHAANLDGGLTNWQQMGLPYTKEKLSEDAGCCSESNDNLKTINLSSGCGCNSGGGSCC